MLCYHIIGKILQRFYTFLSFTKIEKDVNIVDPFCVFASNSYQEFQGD